MIKINNDNWKIKIIKPYSRIFLKDDFTYAIGVCDNSSKTIYLANNLTTTKFKKVLIHEIIHAIIFSYNIILSKKQEELVANIIASHGENILRLLNEIKNYNYK